MQAAQTRSYQYALYIVLVDVAANRQYSSKCCSVQVAVKALSEDVLLGDAEQEYTSLLIMNEARARHVVKITGLALLAMHNVDYSVPCFCMEYGLQTLHSFVMSRRACEEEVICCIIFQVNLMEMQNSSLRFWVCIWGSLMPGMTAG